MADSVAIWWLEPGDEAASRVRAMPGATFKFVCALDAEEAMHVVCGGAAFLEHRDLARAYAATGARVVVVGGGFGGERFPGVSQAYGAPPPAFLAALGATEGPPRAPAWAGEALALLGAGAADPAAVVAAAEACDDWRVAASAHELGVWLELYDDDGRHDEGLVTAEALSKILGERFRILELGDERLRRVAPPLHPDAIGSDHFRERVAWMLAHLEGNGVGVAAPQLAWNVRVLVVQYRAEKVAELPASWREELGIVAFGPQVLVNPQIEVLTSETAVFYEGCMSVPDRVGLVRRPTAIRVRALDAQGSQVDLELRGYLARIVLHESDHLDGVLYTDRVEAGSLARFDDYLEARSMGLSPTETLRHVGARAGLSPR